MEVVADALLKYLPLIAVAVASVTAWALQQAGQRALKDEQESLKARVVGLASKDEIAQMRGAIEVLRGEVHQGESKVQGVQESLHKLEVSVTREIATLNQTVIGMSGGIDRIEASVREALRDQRR